METPNDHPGQIYSKPSSSQNVSSYFDTNNPISKNLHNRFKGAISTIAILIIAPLVALFLTAFVFQSYEVDGPSMETTLSNHDRLIVLKIPRTWARITGNTYIPNRGDIVVFNQNGLEDFGDSESKQLIKRVIGLPGERVVIKEGVLSVYNQENPNGFLPDKTLSYGRFIQTTPGNLDITLGKDQLFVIGDNRPNSLDSRSFGAISAKNVIGKLVLRIFPLSKAKAF